MKYVFRNKFYTILAGTLDILGRGLFFFDRSTEKFPKDIRSILVIRLDHIGDVLRATGVPKILKENYPNARVLFLTNRSGAALLQRNPFVDDILVLETNWYQNRASASGHKRSDTRRLIKHLREQKIDLGLSLRGDIREHWLLFRSGVRFRVGYGNTGGGFLLNKEVAYPVSVHENERTLRLLWACRANAGSLTPKIYFSDAVSGDRRKYDIGIQLDAGTKAKQWEGTEKMEFLNALFKKLSRNKVVFIGNDEHTQLLVETFLKEHPSARWVNEMRATSLQEMLSTIASCRFFMGSDSGPTHVAASLGLETLFLFSGTNRFDEWKPLAENAHILRQDVACSPCHLTQCTVKGHPCMSGIDPLKAIGWIEERLS